MSKDIGPILEGWPHEPGQVSVRKVRGEDGRVKVQLRIDLGVMQMEWVGRPDGQKPYGCESVLEHVEKGLDRYRKRHGTENGFVIDEKLCDQLRSESVQYYYRYLSLFALEEYEGVARDTARNLRVLDVFAAFAAEESDRYIMEQYRPYIIMMNTRARAQLALRDSRPRAAKRFVEDALNRLRGFFERFGEEELEEGSSEVMALRALLKEIEKKIPEDPLSKLQRQLAKAVAEERYEEAARLRDAIGRAGAEPDQGP